MVVPLTAVSAASFFSAIVIKSVMLVVIKVAPSARSDWLIRTDALTYSLVDG